MPFKHGRLGELWLNEVDVSVFFSSVDVALKLATTEVTTLKTGGVATTWKSYIAGLAESTLSAAGYYDSSEADQVRETLQEVVGQATYLPAGGIAIGDQARLLNINSTDYKTGSFIGTAVTLDWTALATSPVGLGECLHVLQSEAPGTITGTGAPLQQGASTTTGAVAHLHVTAMTGGDTHTFKLQDSTTLGGAYTDIASGAFVNVTAVGSQRLVIPGTIRAFVRAVSVISTHAATFGIAAART
jgi:hypothetical protein